MELAHLDRVQPAKPAGSRPRFFSDQLVSSMTRHQPGWLHENPRRTNVVSHDDIFNQNLRAYTKTNILIVKACLQAIASC
jgi:hypothetical protein